MDIVVSSSLRDVCNCSWGQRFMHHRIMPFYRRVTASCRFPNASPRHAVLPTCHCGMSFYPRVTASCRYTHASPRHVVLPTRHRGVVWPFIMRHQIVYTFRLSTELPPPLLIEEFWRDCQFREDDDLLPRRENTFIFPWWIIVWPMIYNTFILKGQCRKIFDHFVFA